MNSLRARLMAGMAGVAVIPLAVSMYLLSGRIEGMVREEAAMRLDSALGGLQAELEARGEETAEKLRLLAADPLLKRLVLVRTGGSRELAEYLAERRFLLDLDLLQVADTSGTVLADGSLAPSTWSRRLVDSVGVEGPVPGGALGLSLSETASGAGLILSATAPLRYEREVAAVLHGGLWLSPPFLARLREAGGMELVLEDGAGAIKASTLAGSERPGEPMSPAFGAVPPAMVSRIQVNGRSYLSRSVPLEIGTLPHARITGLVPTAPADRTIATLRVTSVLLGFLGLGLAVALGFVWSSQVSRPVERLADFSRKVAQGDWDEPLSMHSVRELESLVEALDRMRRDLRTYRDRLVTTERQAAWSQMARRVAHEIKNPLTPISVSVSDLKRSYDQGREDFPAVLDQAVRTISEELATMKALLQEFSDFARLPPPRFAPCRVQDLLNDLGALYGREVQAGRLVLAPPNVPDIPADAGQLRQALVNLVKNGLEATGGNGKVGVEASTEDSALVFRVSDTGPGLSAEALRRLFEPGFSTKSEGSGLGLTLVQRIVHDHGGTIAVDSAPGRGTEFKVRLPLHREDV